MPRIKIRFIGLLLLSSFFIYWSVLTNAQDRTPPLLQKIIDKSLMLNNLIVMDTEGNCEKVNEMNKEVLKDIALFYKKYGRMKLPKNYYIPLCSCEKAGIRITNSSSEKSEYHEFNFKVIINTEATFVERELYDLSKKRKEHIDTRIITTPRTPANYVVEKYSGWIFENDDAGNMVKSPIVGYWEPNNSMTFLIQPLEGNVEADQTDYAFTVNLLEIYFSTKYHGGRSGYMPICTLPGIEDTLSGTEFTEAIKNGFLRRSYRLVFDDCLQSDYEVEIKFKPTYNLTVAPKDGFQSSGPDIKGKFVPKSKTYTLKNTGNDALNYKVVSKADWLKISNASGTLAPGKSTKVTISVLETTAKKLKDDTYKSDVKFINLTDGSGNTSRKAILEVGEEQLWQLKLTGYEQRQYEIPKWKNPNNEPIRYGGRFDYKLEARFIIKKRKGNWTYKNGTITFADINYGTLYDPTYWLTKNEKNKNFYLIKNLKGKPIDGTVDGNKVRLSWPVPHPAPERYVEAQFTKPCKPLPECKEWKAIEYASEEFLDRAGDHFLQLKDGWVSPQSKPFVIKRPGDKLRWLNYRYVLKKLAPK